MGSKDIAEKSLEELNDVFADIVNVLLFNGKQVISQDELVESNPHSNYTSNGKIKEQERDVSKYWNNSFIRLAAIGIENETIDENDMPLRLMSYDGAGYRAQFSPKNNNRRYPVVSLVLYYGYKNRWRKSKTLHDSLDIPPELKEYVSDYKMNLFEIAYLSDEKVDMFKSDFRFVADYFVQMRKTGKYVPPSDKILHVHELLSLMSALTDDNRFVEIYDEVKGKERVNMCTVLDEVEERGIEKGIEKGKELGEITGKVSARFEDGMPIEEIAKKSNVSIEIVKDILKEKGMI
ncbi:Rpn family recombination-promoting nuclease/putative transposase [Butyrivibrio sp. WCD3002]|uniref:Rpn family recombination-promoting nuclease/putative transposase n=1 Tax=Butyrivibrio sp. WCD3002 TaxID=1280676 RepID=UPI00040A1849|nr:Rpn family recombination-promoting nuclease/putative transposase [Butyrivibrio sp. WCD3002]